MIIIAMAIVNFRWSTRLDNEMFEIDNLPLSMCLIFAIFAPPSFTTPALWLRKREVYAGWSWWFTWLLIFPCLSAGLTDDQRQEQAVGEFRFIGSYVTAFPDGPRH